MSGNGDIAIRVYQWCNSSTPFLKKEDQGQNLADPFEMPLPARGHPCQGTGPWHASALAGGYVAATAMHVHK